MASSDLCALCGESVAAVQESAQEVMDRHFCAICQVPLPPRFSRGRWPKTCGARECKKQYRYLHAFDKRKSHGTGTTSGTPGAVNRQRRRLREWVQLGELPHEA